jgi:hypothetical protein
MASKRLIEFIPIICQMFCSDREHQVGSICLTKYLQSVFIKGIAHRIVIVTALFTSGDAKCQPLAFRFLARSNATSIGWKDGVHGKIIQTSKASIRIILPLVKFICTSGVTKVPGGVLIEVPGYEPIQRIP